MGPVVIGSQGAGMCTLKTENLFLSGQPDRILASCPGRRGGSRVCPSRAQPTSSWSHNEKLSCPRTASEGFSVQDEPTAHSVRSPNHNHASQSQKGNKNQRKRIRKKENNRKLFSLKLFGNNVNVLFKNLESFNRTSLSYRESFDNFLQETKLDRSGRIKLQHVKLYMV